MHALRSRPSRRLLPPRIVDSGVLVRAVGEAGREAIRVQAVRQSRQRHVSAHDGVDGIGTSGKVMVLSVFQARLDRTTGTIGRALRPLRCALHHSARRTGSFRVASQQKRGVAGRGHTAVDSGLTSSIVSRVGLCRRIFRRATSLRAHRGDHEAKKPRGSTPHSILRSARRPRDHTHHPAKDG
jgi:hypothetical protein